MPVNVVMIRALLSAYLFYGDDFKVECPTGSGHEMTLFEVAREIANRLAHIFLRDDNGRRAVFGETEKFQSRPVTGATTSCSTSTSTGITGRASEQATRPAGPGWWRV